MTFKKIKKKFFKTSKKQKTQHKSRPDYQSIATIDAELIPNCMTTLMRKEAKR